MKLHTLSSQNVLDPKLYLANNKLHPLSDIKEIPSLYSCLITAFKLEKGIIGYKRNVLNIQ